MTAYFPEIFLNSKKYVIGSNFPITYLLVIIHHQVNLMFLHFRLKALC